MDLIHDATCKEVLVEEIMSEPDLFMADTKMTMAQAREILSERSVNALMICEDENFMGSLSGLDFVKAERSNRMGTSVKGYMRRQVPRAGVTHNARQALELMNQSDDGILPVVDDNRLVGVLTRGDILLQIYDI